MELSYKVVNKFIPIRSIMNKNRELLVSALQIYNFKSISNHIQYSYKNSNLILIHVYNSASIYLEAFFSCWIRHIFNLDAITVWIIPSLSYFFCFLGESRLPRYHVRVVFGEEINFRQSKFSSWRTVFTFSCLNNAQTSFFSFIHIVVYNHTKKNAIRMSKISIIAALQISYIIVN